MGSVLAVCNQKGGVGKSTTAVNIASYIALSGRKTLLVDLDAQGNASTSCGAPRNLARDVYQAIINDVPLREAVIQTPVDRLDLVPSSIELAGAEPYLATLSGREFVIRRACDAVRQEYECVIFDCPPSLGLITVNAMVAAEKAIVPVQCEYLALEGLNSLMRAIELVKKNLNPALQLGGIVLTMTDFRSRLNREVAEEVRSYFKEAVFETAIPRNIRLAEAPSFGKPICLYDPNSPGAISYQLLAQEVMMRCGIGVRSEQQAVGT
ncbi:MAG TPA: ParA family protein [bacterium]